MRLKLLLSFFIPLFLFCQPSQDSNNNQLLASDKQRSWCIAMSYTAAPINLLQFTQEEVNLYYTFSSARSLHLNDSGIAIEPKNFQKNLKSNEESELRVCKIWADINDID